MIVGLCGYARVGKDTAASNMPGFQRRAFADHLKAEMENWLITYYRFDPLGPTLGSETRESWERRKAILRPLLVAHGACRRAFDPDYWINALYTRYIGHWFDGDIAITDVRYLNEARWVAGKMHGRLVYIARPGYGPANDEEARSIQEIRESDLPRLTVINDGTPADLGRKIVEAL